MLTVLASIVFLSFCTGIMLIGTILYLYAYSFTRTRLYLATVIVGALGIIYTGNDMLVVLSSVLGMERLGMQFHRIEALSITLYMFALPYVFHQVLELTPALKRINRMIYLGGLAIAVIFIICAFITPDLFLGFTKRAGFVPTEWNSGRAVPGILYRVRDLIIILLSFYSIALMIIEIRITRKTRHIILFLVGLIVGILTGVADLLIAIREIETGLFSIRVFPFFCLGITVFTVMAMVSIMKLFIDQTRTLEHLKKNEYLELLAGGIAHDFNNILTGVLANASLALEITSGTDRTRSLLAEIEKATLRAKDLSAQLLTFSRGGIISRSLVSIADLICNTVRFSLAGSNIDVHFAMASDLLNASVDVNKISQVLQNLAINAKQAMAEGGRLLVGADNITLTNRTPHLGPGTYIRIRFRDTGIGIPQNMLNAIFEPYFTTKQGGEGLGLAISYSIIKKHSGHIEVSSKVNEGSVFTVYLPASDEQVSEKAATSVSGRCFSGKVLLMDDEELILKIGANLLSHMGFTPVCVKCGEEGVEEFRRALESGSPFVLIILDLTITCGMGGIETVKRIRELDPSVRVIVSTGYAQDLTVSEYDRFGFDGAILKPYTYDEFRKGIEKVLA